MRLMVFFDLPVGTSVQRKNYRQFRKYLIQNGYMMLQESVYCKLVLNGTVANAYRRALKKHRPPEGLVQVLTVTEKQFSNMEYLVGTSSSQLINDDRRLVII